MGSTHSTLGLAASPASVASRRYLLVVQGDSASTFPLPAQGEVVIGRAPDATLRITDPAASRRHATLLLSPEAVHAVDAGSHNGTLVNGQRITPARLLVSGDIVAIGEVSLVYYSDPLPARPASLGDSAQLVGRLSQEIARAADHQSRVVAVVCLDPAGGAKDRAAFAAAIAALLKPVDALAWDEDGARVLLLLADLFEGEVEDRVEALMQALLPTCASLRAGHAAYPADGNDADTLLGGAREAAGKASAGQALGVSDSVRILQIGQHKIVVADPAMHKVYDLLHRLAQSDLAVLITGETGAGKEIAAAAIHHGSPRRDRPFLALNCAALPEQLVESELFGHEKGAFTGAVAQKLGLLEATAGGTLFLDELGELPLAVQAKLLRAIETRTVRRLASTVERVFDLRLVAATNRDLPAEVEARRFRQDLYFRLGAACVALPPLRERRRELPVLARHFLEEACRAQGRPPMAITAAAMNALLRHPWPGNLRELRNVMACLAVLQPTAPALQAHHLDGQLGGAPRSKPPGRPLHEELEDLERTRIEEAMAEAGQVQARAAERLGIPVRTLYNKLKLYRIRRRSETP